MTTEDLASLRGSHVVDAEIRDGVLRLHLDTFPGCIAAISVDGDGSLKLTDESAIP